MVSHSKLLPPHKLRAPSPLTYPPALPLRWEEGRQKEGEGHQRGLGPK